MKLNSKKFPKLSQVLSYINKSVPKGQCDCGATSTGSDMHSNWCKGVQASKGVPFKEHSHILFPQELVDLGFTDTSWANDETASATKGRLLVYVWPDRFEAYALDSEGMMTDDLLFEGSLEKLLEFLKTEQAKSLM